MEINELFSRLEASYGVAALEIIPLFLGADFYTRTFRVHPKKGEDLFLKIRENSFDLNSVMIPQILSEKGMKGIIPPIPTKDGELRVQSGTQSFILYPFVSDISGWERDLSEGEWKKFGKTLRFLHEVPLQAFEGFTIPQENFASGARQKVLSFLLSSPKDFPKDSPAAELHLRMKEREKLLFHILERAESLGQSLAGKKQEFCLCHGDIHAGNILLEPSESFFIVDWDTLVCAPKERDLMFIGGGIGGKWTKELETEWFYRGYGKTEIDRQALVYYRYERIVQDVAEFCDFFAKNHEKKEESMEALSLFASQFEENNVVSIALQTDWKP